MSAISVESLLNKSASSINDAELFGYASTKKTLADVIELMKNSTAEDTRSAAAAYGMLLSANLFEDGPYRDDVLNALDQLSLTKMLLDKAACHTSPVIDVTCNILLAAQKFAEEATIPCTEWPSTSEITEIVLTKAKDYSRISEWKLYKYNDIGAVIGTYIANFPQ